MIAFAYCKKCKKVTVIQKEGYDIIRAVPRCAFNTDWKLGVPAECFLCKTKSAVINFPAVNNFQDVVKLHALLEQKINEAAASTYEIILHDIWGDFNRDGKVDECRKETLQGVMDDRMELMRLKYAIERFDGLGQPSDTYSKLLLL